tara:strand:+ start:109 stop:819 length:711 start_codon:yes stop_codon:yes gene_type:complete
VKVVILAGGKGSRISYYSEKIPKPMIKIGNVPMLSHIMRYFMSYGYDDFIIAAGYKKKIISNFYKNSKEFKKLRIINTGLNTMTGGRILKLKKILKGEIFFLTYGDGISNINLNDLEKFHREKNKIATVSAVRPPVKFGEISIGKNNLVKSFIEKPQLNSGWINGGFFVLNNNIFDYIKDFNTVFEREPLATLAKKKQLNSFIHKGYWRCMDNLNEKNQLEKIYKKFRSIWRIKNI